MDLENKVALVTGGARRIGRAISLALATAGARVAVHYGGSALAAEETVSEIEAKGGSAFSFQADLKNEDAANSVIPAVLKEFDRVDILINNAAVFKPGSLSETTSEHWDLQFQINLKTPFLLSQAFAAQMDLEHPGKIINITDWRILRPNDEFFAYTLTKSGIEAMTRSLAVTLAPQVQVNCLALGAILPPAGASADYQEQLISKIPARRMGGTRDVIQTLMFLLQDGDFITGETILIDGGRHLV